MIVIDASAMVSALSRKRPNLRARRLVADEDLHAPALVDFEVASAMRGLVISNQLDRASLSAALSDYAALEIERHQMTSMLTQILDLRDNFTAYDAAYVVLAQALDAQLVTTDNKLAEARRLGVSVLLVGDAGN